MRGILPRMSDSQTFAAALLGRWTGAVQTWLDPEAPPTVNEMTGELTRALDGKSVLHNYQSKVGDKRADGLMILGEDIATNRGCCVWIDTFHTGSNVMLFAAESQAADRVSLTGSYAAGEETWGWRLVVQVIGADELRFEHTNIGPDGTEWPAIRVDYKRA